MICSAVASVLSNSWRPYGLQPTRLLCPWDSPARLLEWVAMLSSRGPSRSRDRTCIFCASSIVGTTVEAISVTIHWIYLFKCFHFNLSMFVYHRYFSCKQYSSYGYFFHFKLWFVFFFSFNWWVTTRYFWMFLSLQNLYFEFLMPSVMVLDDRGFGKWLGCEGGAHPQWHTWSQASSPN